MLIIKGIVLLTYIEGLPSLHVFQTVKQHVTIKLLLNYKEYLLTHSLLITTVLLLCVKCNDLTKQLFQYTV